jgi:ABC-type antimicrobial peptide transport system permease subunit
MSAIALIAVGLFGVLGSLVARRTREIGLRMALGARRGRLAAFVALQALAMTAIGIATGTVLALPAAQVLAPFLFETSPRDPVSFVLAGLLLVALSLAASYVPARRAARVDPLIALRTE